MKKLIAVVLFAVALNVQAQAPTVAVTGPAITFEKDMIDFGTVAKGSDQVRTFTFTNTGDAPLVISSIKGQCGCTTIPDWPKEPIAPGGTGSFQVKYDTNRGPGQFDKKIIITSNAVAPTMEVRIMGNVVEK